MRDEQGTSQRRTPSSPSDGTAGPLPAWPLWAALFALAYGQSPLFTSNQNQYFLHGLARAGYGALTQDWLANTVDPTPVFSALVQGIASVLPHASFYFLYGLLLALYFLSLRGVLYSRWDLSTTPLRRALTSAGLILLHAAATRFALNRTLSADAAFLLEGGFAGQRLLGAVLQPSAFGVFLMVAILLFVRDRPYAAVSAAVLAATVHPTYLLSAGALTAGMLWTLYWQDGEPRRAIRVGALAILLVLPTVAHTYAVFRPSSPSTAAQAARLLAEERIPHHAIPAAWFSWQSVVKAAMIAVGLLLSWRSRLRPLLAAPLLLGAALTVIQLATGNNRLALLFPWRPSVLLVPLSTALVWGWLIVALTKPPARSGRAFRGLAVPPFLLAVLLAAAGLGRTVLLAQARAGDPASQLFDHVTQVRRPGDRYLIPPKLQRFRLATGAPAFVDFKAIPYQDSELLEWNERLELAQFFYRDDPALISCGLLPRIHSVEPFTHVVLEEDQFGLDCPGLDRVFGNDVYALFRYQP